MSERPTRPRRGGPQGPRSRTSAPRILYKPTVAELAAAAPTPEKRRELKYYGINACLALWQRRPQDIIRIYLEEALIPRFSDALRWAANQRKAYHVVQREDLERLTESTHHQGICILALEHAPIPFRAVDSRLCQLKGPQLLVYLDGVENPHNFGAILRSCAHFGARYVLGDASRLPTLSPSACRVAEGGAEHVSVIQLDRPTEQLQMLKDAGYQLCSTAVHRGRNLFRHHFAPRSILALGAEETGVTATVARLADARLTIPGAATVESLNVGVAFAVFAAEFYRQSASDD